MRKILIATLVILAGCSSGVTEASDETATSDRSVVVAPKEEPPVTTHVIAADVDQRFIDAFGELSWTTGHGDQLVQIGARYCADLERGVEADARASVEKSLASHMRVYGNNGDAAALMAGPASKVLADVAVTELCPEQGIDKYLPD